MSAADQTSPAASHSPARLSQAQVDRVAGTMLAAACGDALGVPYEFGTPLAADVEPRMLGGGLGPYAPGEYSDDTQMAVCIGRVTATGADLCDTAALDAVATNFLDWFQGGATDVGAQTRSVLLAGGRAGGPHPSVALREASATLHQQTGRTAGNGSLMRTAPVALAYLHDAERMAEAARQVSRLTHHDGLAGDACVLWCAAIRRAVLDGTLEGIQEGLALLPTSSRDAWAARIDEAEHNPPGRFCPNGFVVPALQAAYSAIVHTAMPGEPAGRHLRTALAAAVRAGDDTDTVAAIAGALAGALWGATAVPAEWRQAVHGWPGLHADDLTDLALSTAGVGRPT